MGGLKSGRLMLVVLAAALMSGVALVGVARAETPAATSMPAPEAPPANTGNAPTTFSECFDWFRLRRVELYSTYMSRDMELNFRMPTVFGTTPIKVDADAWRGMVGVRLFPTHSPIPYLDMSYSGGEIDADGTATTPFGPITTSRNNADHEFRLGAMTPVPKIGFLKIGADDMEDSSSYGIYLVPRLGDVVPQLQDFTGKLGVEWSQNSGGAPDDSAAFIIGTMPYRTWRFSMGYSNWEEGYQMGGVQVGKQLGQFFVAAGGYIVESDDPAFAILVGRGAEDVTWGPSFWLVHLNNPVYHRTNAQIAFGKPGVPRAAMCNPLSNGIYTAMYTDQMGTVLPIPVRNFEEMRLWKRPDEFAQTGEGGRGGVAIALDSTVVTGGVGYELHQAGLFYTHERLGPCIYPHIGPLIESEKLPVGGWQDVRLGLELGTYLGNRPPDQFYQAGRFFVGMRALSDFDDYLALIGAVRVSF